MLSLRSASTPRFGRDKIITNSVVCACKIVGYKLCLLETRSGKKSDFDDMNRYKNPFILQASDRKDKTNDRVCSLEYVL